MKAKEFFALDLQPGERVFVQIGAHEPKVAVFDGYRCFKYTVRNFNYDLIPIFRMPAKNGGMLRISVLGKDSCVCHAYSDIVSVRRFYTPEQIENAIVRKNEALARIDPATELRKEPDGRYGIYSVKTNKLQTIIYDEELLPYLKDYLDSEQA